MPDRDRPAVLQLPTNALGTRRSITCNVEGMRGKRLLLSASEKVGESTVVSVEHEDTLLIGEVIACANVEGRFQLEIHVEQMLTGLQSLMALRANLLGEGVAAPSALVPMGVRK